MIGWECTNIAFYRYFNDCLKDDTRIDYPPDFPHNDKNKNALNECLSQKLIYPRVK